MQTSSNGIELIKEHEKLRLKAYLDAVGIPTIGYGHTKGVKIGQTITEDQAIEFLKEDLSVAENAINKQNLSLNQNQFDALVSFVFNVGTGSFQSSTLLKKAKADSNDTSIALEFAKWKYGTVKGKKVVLGGLVKRRKNESDLYFKK